MQPLSLETLIEDVERQASSPLKRLGFAVSRSAELYEICDDLVGRFVEDARRGGCSWTEIGGVLGVTKQAAQQRFPSAGAELWPVGFREDAQHALGAAGERARRFGHPYLGTEHVLLALTEQ